MVLELARCEFIARRENVLLLGNSGTGKTHIALALGLAACQRGHRVRFTTAAALVSELIEARDEKKLLRFQKQIASYELLIVDELGFVPLSKTGAELLFEMLSQRYERGSTLVTSNLPFAEWTEVLGSERLTGALLDRLTHHAVSDVNEITQCRLFAHDADVMSDRGTPRHAISQRCQVSSAAYKLQRLAIEQLLCERADLNRLICCLQIPDGRVNLAMCV